jgi:hypothetical protein
MKSVSNFLSWFGILLILSAYILNVFNVLDTRNILYLVFNIVGSIFILIQAFHRRDYQPAVLNIVWATVALVNLIIVLK